MNKISVTYDETEWLYVNDVIYSSVNGLERRLQLFVPYKRDLKDDVRYPVVLYIPGAAWHRQEMYNDVPKLAKLAEQGIVVAMIQHRESDIALFPAPVEDMHRAANYLIENAKQFHIDPTKLYLAGHSSGAHLALMTAFTKANGAWIPETVGMKDYEIKGVIAQAAPSDLMLCHEEELPPWMEKRPTAELLGVDDLKKYPKLAEQASCGMYVNEQTAIPSVLLLHGENDSIVTVEHSRRLYKLLTEKKKDVTYYEIEKEDHSGNVFWTKEILQIMRNFCYDKV